MKGFPEISDVCLDVENDTLIAYYTISDESGTEQKADQKAEQKAYSVKGVAHVP